MNPWRKFFLFLCIVALPALIVGVCNYNVFPDSSFVMTVMICATVGVAAVFTWKSRQATRRVAQYCIVADIFICIVLCVNGGGHLLLSRELSAAKQGLAERHIEEDREGKRRDAEAERQVKIAQANAEILRNQTAQIQAESRRLSRLPYEQRRSILSDSRPVAEIAPAPTAPAVAVESKLSRSIPRLTPDEVLAEWAWFLTVMSFVDFFASVLAGAVLIGVWEWDRNQNGIPDHEEIEPPRYQTPVNPRPLFTGSNRKK